MELIADTPESRAGPVMVANESATFRNALPAFDNARVVMRAGRRGFDKARTALDKQTVAFGTAAVKCDEQPPQLPQRAEKLSNGASEFSEPPVLLHAQARKASKKKGRSRARHTTFGNGVMSMLPHSTKAARGFAIIGNAFLLQFPQIGIAQERTGGIQRNHRLFNVNDEGRAAS